MVLRNHINGRNGVVLANAGVIAELLINPGERVRGYPYKFYPVIEQARALFDRNDLFPADAWRGQYDRVEKAGKITELEAMRRPD